MEITSRPQINSFLLSLFMDMIVFCCSVPWTLLSTDVPQRSLTIFCICIFWPSSPHLSPKAPGRACCHLTFLAPQIPHHHVIHSLGSEDGSPWKSRWSKMVGAWCGPLCNPPIWVSANHFLNWSHLCSVATGRRMLSWSCSHCCLPRLDALEVLSPGRTLFKAVLISLHSVPEPQLLSFLIRTSSDLVFV